MTARVNRIYVTTLGDTTRRRLLDAATVELVNAAGDIELAAVARRAKVSPGAPYRHFESKAALLRTLVDDFYDRFEAAVFDPPLVELGTWKTREVERTRRFVAFYYAEPLSPVLLSSLSCEWEMARAQAVRLERAKLGAAKNIARGQREGAIPKDLDPQLAGAAVIGGFLHGLAAALGRARPLPQARVAEALTRFLSSALELR